MNDEQEVKSNVERIRSGQTVYVNCWETLEKKVMNNYY